MDKLYIIIPAYNEEETVAAAIAQWHPIAEQAGAGSRLVIIDDGSRDRTLKIASGLKKKYPRLTVLTKENQGHGAAVLYGYKYAIRKGADYVFQTDSDGQTLPSEFPVFWAHRKDGGLLIGCRTYRQDGLSRIFVTKTLRLVLLAAFHVWLKDANSPYRLMSCGQLQDVLRNVPKNFFLSNVLISVLYSKKNLGVSYYPISFLPRQGGKNSISIRKIFKIGLTSLWQFFALQKIWERHGYSMGTGRDTDSRELQAAPCKQLHKNMKKERVPL